MTTTEEVSEEQVGRLEQAVAELREEIDLLAVEVHAMLDERSA